MEFYLPLKPEDILNEPSDNRVWVQTLTHIPSLPESQQREKLEELKNSLFSQEDSPLLVLAHFELLFSFVNSLSSLPK